MSFGKLLIVYHNYISEKHILSPPIFVSLRSFAEARLRIYIYWQSGGLELAGKVNEAEIILHSDVLNRVSYPAHSNLIAATER